MRKPRVLTKCVANSYTGPTERIIEFSSGKRDGTGGLISFRNIPSGELLVQVYRVSGNVVASLPTTPHRQIGTVTAEDRIRELEIALRHAIDELGRAALIFATNDHVRRGVADFDRISKQFRESRATCAAALVGTAKPNSGCP